MSAYFVQTSNDEKIVMVERDCAEVVDAADGPSDFGLTNTLRASAMREARAAAKEAGLKLRRPSAMGVLVSA